MRKSLLLISLAFFATGVGAWITSQSGISYFVFLPNVLSLVLGSLIFFRSEKIEEFFTKRADVASLFVLVLIGASLLFSGIDSVHRWISIGPLRLNVSMAFVPVILFASLYGHKIWTALVMGMLAFIYILQPDAGQATAFCSAGIIIFTFDRSRSVSLRVSSALCLMVLTVFAWTRLDPLPPVAYVEQILHLAYSQGPLQVTVAILSIVLLLAPFVWLSLKSFSYKGRVLAGSFFVWFLVSYLVTEYGNFPVPILGAGAAPVLGWFLATTLVVHQPSDRP